jgi:hypothetical protein
MALQRVKLAEEHVEALKRSGEHAHDMRLQAQQHLEAFNALKAQNETAMWGLRDSHNQVIARFEADAKALRAAHAAELERVEARSAATVATLLSEMGELRRMVADLAASTSGRWYEIVAPAGPGAQRKFVVPREGAFPPPPPGYLRFDPAWAAASAAGTTFRYAVDPAFTAVRCARHNGVVGTEETFLTLRAAEPLPREPLVPQQLPIMTNASAAVPADLADAPRQLMFHEAQSDQTAPLCRFVVDGYGLMDDASPRPEIARCVVGFLPSTAVATPMRPIRELGGWHMALSNAGVSSVSGRWVPVAPVPGEGSGKGWATAQEVPSMPVGGGVEFTVDYAKSSVRAAFYSPQAVAAGFAASPFARMELRMIKPLPRDVVLYPAIHLFRSGQAVRFA